MNKISKFLILLGSIAIILYAMNKWVYPIESSYTCDSDRIKELAKESISREKLLDHLILGEAGIERIYDIQEISSKDGKRLCRALIDTGSIFPGLEMEEYKLTLEMEPTDDYKKAKQDLIQAMRSIQKLSPQQQQMLAEELFEAANVMVLSQILRQYLR